MKRPTCLRVLPFFFCGNSFLFRFRFGLLCFVTVRRSSSVVYKLCVHLVSAAVFLASVLPSFLVPCRINGHVVRETIPSLLARWDGWSFYRFFEHWVRWYGLHGVILSSGKKGGQRRPLGCLIDFFCLLNTL